MSILAKAAALLHAADPRELDAMTPAELQRLSDLMWQWHRLCERRLPAATRMATARIVPPRSGVLASLYDGERSL